MKKNLGYFLFGTGIVSIGHNQNATISYLLVTVRVKLLRMGFGRAA